MRRPANLALGAAVRKPPRRSPPVLRGGHRAAPADLTTNGPSKDERAFSGLQLGAGAEAVAADALNLTSHQSSVSHLLDQRTVGEPWAMTRSRGRW
jgi:hypothetical protein